MTKVWTLTVFSYTEPIYHEGRVLEPMNLLPYEGDDPEKIAWERERLTRPRPYWNIEVLGVYSKKESALRAAVNRLQDVLTGWLTGRYPGRDEFIRMYEIIKESATLQQRFDVLKERLPHSKNVNHEGTHLTFDVILEEQELIKDVRSIDGETITMKHKEE